MSVEDAQIEKKTTTLQNSLQELRFSKAHVFANASDRDVAFV